MQQEITTRISEYLPMINVDELSFNDKNTAPYTEELNHFTESIQTWSHTILEKAKLPTSAHEAKGLTNKYGLNKDEGCALRMVIELETLQKSLDIHDASTAALASMKLLESIWYSSLFKEQTQASPQNSGIGKSPAVASKPSASNQSEEKNDTQLYQETINDLRDKYPHCNINALRLLAATRLNIGKQELDDLNITPD